MNASVGPGCAFRALRQRDRRWAGLWWLWPPEHRPDSSAIGKRLIRCSNPQRESTPVLGRRGRLLFEQAHHGCGRDLGDLLVEAGPLSSGSWIVDALMPTGLASTSSVIWPSRRAASPRCRASSSIPGPMTAGTTRSPRASHSAWSASTSGASTRPQSRSRTDQAPPRRADGVSGAPGERIHNPRHRRYVRTEAQPPIECKRLARDPAPEKSARRTQVRHDGARWAYASMVDEDTRGRELVIVTRRNPTRTRSLSGEGSGRCSRNGTARWTRTDRCSERRRGGVGDPMVKSASGRLTPVGRLHTVPYVRRLALSARSFRGCSDGRYRYREVAARDHDHAVRLHERRIRPKRRLSVAYDLRRGAQRNRSKQ